MRIKLALLFALVMIGLAFAIAALLDRKATRDFNAKRDVLRGYVAAAFKDPDSAKFKNEVFIGGVLCGTADAKNGFGAYLGGLRFMSAAVDDVHIEGYGSIGKASTELKTTEALVAGIDARIDLSKRIDTIIAAARKNGNENLTREDVEARMEIAAFDNQWRARCTP